MTLTPGSGDLLNSARRRRKDEEEQADEGERGPTGAAVRFSQTYDHTN